MEETLLCKGVPYCDNKIDLKWCKNTTTVLKNWKPIVDRFMCILIPLPEGIAPRGQWIKTIEKDDNVYHCINRADENPFTKKNNSMGDDSQQNWMNLVNSPCPDAERRCLGRRPHQCIEIEVF